MFIQFHHPCSSFLKTGKEFLADEEANTALEYALMMSLGVGIAYPVATETKDIIVTFFDRIGQALDRAAR